MSDIEIKRGLSPIVSTELLIGNSGNDILFGNGGDDTLDGGIGRNASNDGEWRIAV